MTRYHPFLVVLHWLLAIMVILGLVMGGNVLSNTPNSDPGKIFMLRMHMGMGIVILILMLIRLVVRFMTTKPPHADIGNALLNKVASLAHYALYIVVILVAGSGLATANLAGLPDIVFGGSGAPLPENFNDIPPRVAHGILTMLLGLLILGHLGAALYHQFFAKMVYLGACGSVNAINYFTMACYSQ